MRRKEFGPNLNKMHVLFGKMRVLFGKMRVLFGKMRVLFGKLPCGTGRRCAVGADSMQSQEPQARTDWSCEETTDQNKKPLTKPRNH
jgi:hypothetical protein